MSGGVRRIWVTVLAGFLGLVVGLTIGFTVGLSCRKVDAAWLEAVGTWFGAGVTLIAVILATIAFFSKSSQGVESTDASKPLTNRPNNPNGTGFNARPTLCYAMRGPWSHTLQPTPGRSRSMSFKWRWRTAAGT